MKKKWLVQGLFAVFFLCIFCVACSKKTEEQNSHLSYSELSRMEEVTVDDSGVTVVLGEDGALPYRWQIMSKSDAVCLKEEYVVEQSDSSDTSVGSSPGYHVFVLELTGQEDVEISLFLMRIGSDLLAEAEGKRYIALTYTEDGWERLQ